MTQQDMLLHWLYEVYSQEQEIAQRLDKEASSKALPATLARHIEHNAEHTWHDASLIKTQIDRLGGAVYPLKPSAVNVTDEMTNWMRGAIRNKLIKLLLTDLADVQLEIGLYNFLLTAAEEAEEGAVQEISHRVLLEKRDTADWLLNEILLATREVIQESE